MKVQKKLFEISRICIASCHALTPFSIILSGLQIWAYTLAILRYLGRNLFLSCW